MSPREALRGIGSVLWRRRAYPVATLAATAAILVVLNVLRAVGGLDAEARLLAAVVVGFLVFSVVERRVGE